MHGRRTAVRAQTSDMLAEQQRSQLDTRGFVHLPRVVDRAGADHMADLVWGSLADRGVERSDPATWPVGYVGKHQGLRRRRVFDAFDTDRTAAVADGLLGTGVWAVGQPWGPALVTFPEAGPWTVPHRTWHFDVPGRAHGGFPPVVRMFGYVTDVVSHGGGTAVVEGSAELVRRMVAEAPGQDAGSSAELRRRLVADHPWFRALCRAGGADGDRIGRFMTDGDEIDGVRVRVSELIAEAGDVVVMHPWTMHALAPNCAASPRFMVTTSIYGHSPGPPPPSSLGR